ncbi:MULTISPECIES: phage tail tube protein [unclassified Chelatococcus]|uniref:phage tail tube protein n=1 Tax=unclassified Chelatococcus TaxID=2638111 RepID=UPI001BCDCE22|nr:MULTISPECIES: phage tail tube protein [unclassified Chelatococcus]MBS7696269.1 hypothetical protein [Chelatococcus sp. YT9]MBX3560056.1 hypothetical protein [Chelatococcus sp.]
MADLQSTNRVKLAKVREITAGVTPPNPAFKEILQTSSGLNAAPQTVTSNIIRSDRQVADLILVGLQIAGDVGGELAFGAADDDFEEALQGTWASKPAIVVATVDTEISDVTATTVTVASGGAAFKAGHLVAMSGLPTPANNKLARVTSSTATTIVFPAATFAIEADPIPVGAAARVVGFEAASADVAAVTAGGNGLTATALDFTTLGLNVGEWVKIGGTAAGTQFATGANNGWARVSAIAAGKLSFDQVPAGWNADTGTGKTIQIFTGDFLKNGTTKRSSTFERQYLDHSPVSYEYFRGLEVNTLSINAPAQQIATYTKGYIGREAEIVSSRASGATDVPSTAGDVLNTSSNVGRIGIGGVEVTGPNFVMSATIEINNNLRAQNAIGSIGAVGIGNGECSVTGTQELYFGDKSIYEAVLGNTPSNFSILFGREDGTRSSILIDLPYTKYSSGAPGVSGKNADVMLSANFQAIRHPTLGYTMAVQRFHYLPA